MNNWDFGFLGIEFDAPGWLWLLIIMPLYVLFIRSSENKQVTWRFSKTEEEQKQYTSKKILIIRKVSRWFSIIAFSLLIITLAKPIQASSDRTIQNRYKNGIDIVLAMDVSLSMYAMDFKPNRLEAAKSVAKEFIDDRIGDRIGLVVFAGEAYTACPTTLDYTLLKDQIDKVNGENLESGTAIGTGLGTAVARLRDDQLKSKVIILLTDGSNNAGEIDPTEAAELARLKNITVYTIGVGTNGNAPTPVITPFGVRYENMPVEIDEKTLQTISKQTNGRYFRATDEKSLSEIYTLIDQLEKRKMLDQKMHTSNPIDPNLYLSIALILLVIQWFVTHVLFKLND